jgi:hypothetical protein
MVSNPKVPPFFRTITYTLATKRFVRQRPLRKKHVTNRDNFVGAGRFVGPRLALEKI